MALYNIYSISGSIINVFKLMASFCSILFKLRNGRELSLKQDLVIQIINMSSARMRWIKSKRMKQIICLVIYMKYDENHIKYNNGNKAT